MAFNVQLKVSSPKTSSVLYSTAITPIKELTVMEFNHPATDGNGPQVGNLNLLYLRDASETNPQKVPKAQLTCEYDLNPNGLNDDKEGKWGLSTNQYASYIGLPTKLKAPCTTTVYIHNGFSGASTDYYAKILATVSEGPFISNNKIQRFLDIKIKGW